MKKKIKLTLIISTVVVFIFSSIIYAKQNAELKQKYNAALALAEEGDVQGALDIISIIGEYKNSEELTEEYENHLDYNRVLDYINEEDYDSALVILERLNSKNHSYKDSADLQDSVEYARAIALAEAGKLNEAYESFKMLSISYKDVGERIRELSYAMNFADKWFCKEHQIDLDITAKVSKENITYLDVVMKDRNGFLLDAEDNKLTGTDLVLMEDRFLWNILGDDTRFAVIMEDNRLKVAKQPVKDHDFIVTFVRKLGAYNAIDGDIDSAVNRDVDGGL